MSLVFGVRASNVGIVNATENLMSVVGDVDYTQQGYYGGRAINFPITFSVRPYLYINNSIVSQIFNSSSWTISMWVKLTESNITAYRYFWHKYYKVLNENQGYLSGGATIALYANPNNKVSMSLYNDNTSTIVGSVDITPNKWTHLATVRDGNQVTTYIDGVASSRGSVSSFPVEDTYFTINAGNYQGSSSSLPFMVDDVAMLDEALWTTDFVPPTKPLTELAYISNLYVDSQNQVWGCI